MPSRQLRNAQTLIDMHTDELMLNWKPRMDGGTKRLYAVWRVAD